MHKFSLLLGTAFFASALSICAAPFTHFEARQTHAIGLTPDGTRLLAVNSPDGRLSVFDVSDAPVLLAEIPVGLEPVAVRARTNDEVWVVSEVGDSVAIVSLSRGVVVETLSVPDEPADVVFAQGRAWVTCARTNLVRVFDAATRQALASIPLQGLVPSALATDAAGTKVYAAFLHTSNGTTILPPNLAPAPPAPTNPALPAAPQTGLIVTADDPRISWTVLDRDVVEIDAATMQVVRYLGGAGTNLFDLAVHPQTGDLWVANTEAHNLVRFEPVLRGHVADHRLTRLAQGSGAATIFDLNAGVDYAMLPNPAAQATALAHPTALAISSDGGTAWVAAFGSDRVAKISTATGEVLARVELRGNGEDSRAMRGPRALVLDENRARLFVLNKLANTISVIGTAGGALLAEIPTGSGDPMPAAIREGRGFLFDARLSGNGTISCATCHLDADRDGLAWDLGDPGGSMVTLTGTNNSAHSTVPQARIVHPMKGPMTTQTLRGLPGMAPFHWRGDRATIQSFNPTFSQLMGGAEIPAADMDALAAYLGTLRHHPNPNRLRDNTMPAIFQGGSTSQGASLFQVHTNHCTSCHALPAGTDLNIDLPAESGSSQPLKNPSLRTVYQRIFFKPQAGQSSATGFGLLHDGSGFSLPTVHPYVLDELSSPAEFDAVRAFVLCFDTGTAPAVGDSRTVTLANRVAATADVVRLEGQSVAARCDLVVRGVIGGKSRSFLFNRATQLYQLDAAGEAALTRSALFALLGAEDAVTFLGVPPGEGARFGGDRDEDGTLDRDEAAPVLEIAPLTFHARLSWPAVPAGWRLESASALSGPWLPATRAPSVSGAALLFDEPISGSPARFYRLRRTW